MVRCGIGALTLLSVVTAISPARARDTLDLSLPSDETQASTPATLSLGPVRNQPHDLIDRLEQWCSSIRRGSLRG